MGKAYKSRFLSQRLDIRIILIIVSVLAVGWLQLPRLGDEFQVDEDFRTFYWMNKFQDSDLFPDYLEGYVELQLPWTTLPISLKSLGYGVLFYFASFFVTPVVFSKLLAFFLMPTMVWYAFKFGQAVRGESTGILLAIGLLFLNLVSSTSFSELTGLQRSFALPLVIIFIYFFYRQKFGRVALVAFIGALIYPPVFVLMVVAWVLSLIKLKARHPYLDFLPSEHGFIFLLIVVVVGLMIMTPVLLPRFTNTFAGPEPANISNASTVEEESSSYQYIWDDPHYGSEGRRRLFVYFPLVGRGGLVNKEIDAFNLLVMFVLSLLIYAVRGRKAFNLPGVIWNVLGASFILFILAWLSILLTETFLFYLPSRYTRIGLYLFLLMFVFLNIEDSIKEALDFVRRNPQKLVWLVVGIGIVIVMLIIWYPSELATIKGFNMKWLLALAGILFTILGTFVFRRRLRAAPNFSVRRGTFSGQIFVGVMGLVLLVGWIIYAPVLLKISSLNPSQSERDLYAFIKTLPKDVLIAGTPCILDSVPLFSKRQILFSCERYGKDDPVVFKALETYYADDYEVLIDFCNDNDIDYLVVDSETYSTEYLQQGNLFFEPHNQKLLTEISDRNQFVLGQVPDEIKLFQVDNYFVVPCDIAKW